MNDKNEMVVQRKVRTEEMGSGRLVIYSTYIDNRIVSEAFTLESLAHVLDLPLTTLDGRYKRGRLSNWKVDIVGRSGRPSRGFPLAMLEKVINIVVTPGAYVQSTESGDRASRDPIQLKGELRPTMYMGKRFYTVPALAESFGYSETTIRNKLNRSGLLKKMQDLGSSRNGGRPQRGFDEKYLPQVKLAIVEGAVFRSEMDRILHRATGSIDAARREVKSMIAPHIPLEKGSLRAYDHTTMAPAIPVNAVNSDMNRRADDVDVDDLMASINAQLATLEIPARAPVTVAPVPAPVKAGKPVLTVVGEHVKIAGEPTPADPNQIVDRLPDDELAAQARSQFHHMLVVSRAERPPEEDFDDAYVSMTEYAGLSEAVAGEIVASLKSQWERRAGGVS